MLTQASPRSRCPRPRRQCAANYRKPPEHTRFKEGQSGVPRRRPKKPCRHWSPPYSTEKVTVTENGKRRQVTKREAVIAQLVNKSASAELRAIKMLIDVLRDIEMKAEPAVAAKSLFSPTGKEVAQQLIARLRRNMCSGCRWAARRDDPDSSADSRDAQSEPAPQPASSETAA